MNTLSLFNPSFELDSFDRDFGLFTPFASRVLSSPNVDVKETKDAYIMEVDLPGLTERDVEINMKDRVLSISSMKEVKKDENKKEEGTEYLIRERRSTSFARRFTLPEDINTENIDASFRNGVLTVSIPRRPETQPRQIMIKTA